MHADFGRDAGGRLARGEEFEGALFAGAQFGWLVSHDASSQFTAETRSSRSRNGDGQERSLLPVVDR